MKTSPDFGFARGTLSSGGSIEGRGGVTCPLPDSFS